MACTHFKEELGPGTGWNDKFLLHDAAAFTPLRTVPVGWRWMKMREKFFASCGAVLGGSSRHAPSNGFAKHGKSVSTPNFRLASSNDFLQKIEKKLKSSKLWHFSEFPVTCPVGLMIRATWVGRWHRNWGDLVIAIGIERRQNFNTLIVGLLRSFSKSLRHSGYAA